MIRDRRIAIDFGQADPECARSDDAQFIVAPPPLWRSLRILLRPNFWTGETFINGDWYLKKGDLAEFLRIIRKQAPRLFAAYYEYLSSFRGLSYYLGQYTLNRYFTRKARKHYDIDALIYEMILDDEMFYTCAFFDDQHPTLAEAQQNKIATAIARMDLPVESPRVLDIGCGWGATERALVRRHPSAEICGLSISASQIEWAVQKDVRSLTPLQAARIEYRLQDYEHHERAGYYDSICVIGMIEHVGLGGYRAFFSQIERLLRPGGTALIHTIVCPVSASPTNRWIDKYIFTGGYAPSVAELVSAIESQPLRVSNIHLHGPANYRRTIEAWIRNLAANADRMRAYLKANNLSDGEAEKIMLTWQFYLSGVRNMFDEDEPRTHQVAQVCIKKP